MKQPNPNSCLAVCLTVLLNGKGLHIKLDDVFSMLGHDGNQLILGKPRQVTIQEVIDVAYIYGYSVTEIILSPMFSDIEASVDLPDDGSVTLTSVYSPEREKQRIDAYMGNHKGFLVGRESFDKRHAVVWLGGGQVLDPMDGQEKSIAESIQVEAFYFLTKIIP